MDRAIRHHDRGLVVFEQRSHVPTGGFVARNYRNGASKARRAQMLAKGIVGQLAPKKRVAHFARAIADPIRRGDRVLGLNEPQLELALTCADAALEARMDRIDLCQNTHVTLTVTLGSDHAD